MSRSQVLIERLNTLNDDAIPSAKTLSIKDIVSYFRTFMKSEGISAKCRITPGNEKTNFQINTPTYEAEFSEDDQRKIRQRASDMGLTLVRGMKIDVDQMTDSKGFTFYKP